MKIYDRVVFDMQTCEVIEEHSFEYEGPVDQCSGGGKSGGDTTVRYAPFLEEAAKKLIDQGWIAEDLIDDQSPYDNYAMTNPSNAFFGVGYTVSSYPSIFDMFGKFMAGLDIEVLHDQEMRDALYGAAIYEAVATKAAKLDADINSNVYPRFEAGVTDMNAAMGSGFMMGRAYIEDGRNKALTEFASTLRMKAMDLGHQRWAYHLQWNAQVISHYLTVVRAYFQDELQYVSGQTQLDTAHTLWPFTVLDHQRAIVGVLNGAHAAAVKKDSGFAKVVSGVLGIASILTAIPTGGTSLLAYGASQIAGGGGASGSGLIPADFSRLTEGSNLAG